MNSPLEVNARRLLCPMPVIRLQDTINKAPPGAEVRIVCTDPGVINDIPAWSRLNGHDVISFKEADREFVFVVKKSPDGN